MTTTPTTSSAPTSYERERLATAQKQGFSFFLVKADGDAPAFVYSIGMAAHGLPDLLMFLDSEYVKPQLGMLTNTLNHMLQGVKLFTPEALTQSLNGMVKTVSDPEITYTFSLLSPNDNDYAVFNYACRANFFRRVLGDPQMMVISSDFNPTLDQVRQLAAN